MTLAAAILVAAHLAGGGPAVARPDFSGYWVWNSDHTRALTGTTPPQPLGPVEWTITDATDAVTMVRPWPIGPPHTFVFKYDGSESVNHIANTTYRSRARWEDGKLIVDSKKVTAIGDAVATGTARWVIWLTPSGDLAIETTQTLDPIEGVTITGRAATPTVQVFVKTARKQT